MTQTLLTRMVRSRRLAATRARPFASSARSQQRFRYGATYMLTSITAPLLLIITATIANARPLSPKQYAADSLKSPSAYQCLLKLWQRESNWRPTANNPTSTAYGIAQLLTETSPDPYTQIRHGLTYIANRYGNGHAKHGTCPALKHHTRLGWY